MFSINNLKRSLLLSMTALSLGAALTTTQANALEGCGGPTCEAMGVMTVVHPMQPPYPAGTEEGHTWTNDLPEAGLPLGEHTYTWTLTKDSDGSVAHTDQNTITVVDTTAPSFERLPNIYVPAEDFLTTITPSLIGTPTANDAVDPNPNITLLGATDAYLMRAKGADIEPDYKLKLRTGMYYVAWVAEDNQGNNSTEFQDITIYPIVSMLQSSTAVIGGNATVAIELNGDPVHDYYYDDKPVRAAKPPSFEVDFTIEFTGTVIDKMKSRERKPSAKPVEHAGKGYDFNVVEITLQQDETMGEATFAIPDDLELTSSDTLVATIVDTRGVVDIGTVSSTNIPLTTENIAPRVQLTSFLHPCYVRPASSGKAAKCAGIDDERTVFDKDGNIPVVIRAAVIDEDETTYEWEVNGAELTSDGEYESGFLNELYYLFTPSDATSNLVTIQLTATDEGGLATTEILEIILTDDTVPTLPSSDSDGDGTDDDDEGFGDTDGDGIADFKDNDPHVNQLPLGDDNDPMFVKEGITLKLGTTKRSADTFNAEDATITDSDLDEHGDKGESAPNNTADEKHPVANRISPVIDFEVRGFPEGETIDIVIPLPEGVSIPLKAVYRKYTPADGWKDFSQNSKNKIASAPRTANNTCPAADSSDYVGILQFGYQCIRLSIEDGGPNDADGLANGVIVDPGVLTVPTAEAPVTPSTPTTGTTTSSTTTTSGGGGGSTGLLIFLLLPLAVFRVLKLKK